jgi:FAD/FMN-containing dehydrogenase
MAASVHGQMRRRARRRPRLPRAGVSRPLRLPIPRRRRWTNHTGNQGVDPVGMPVATSADDLVSLVELAASQRLTVRAVGSGHSWSDVALTTGYLITPDGFSGCEMADRQLLRDGVDENLLVSVGSGTTLHDLNTWLDHRDLALTQMGGYDGQTIAGVVSTSTHGSGITFPPFPDMVRSLDLIDGSGRRLRIEPHDGPSARAAFQGARPDWTLIQEDECFDAAVCGMGCMGLIVSLMIEVRDHFRLTEVRTDTTWSEVQRALTSGVLDRHDHYEVYINPYARDGPGSNRCIVTTREPLTGKPAASHRPILPELLGHLPWVTAAVMQLAGSFAPGVIPWLLDMSLGAIKCDGYTNRSFKVFNIGSVNNLRAYSAEMAVPIADGGHIKAVEAVLETTDRYRRLGRIYHTAPVALRFVAPSRAMMSMMHRRQTMMIELIQLVDTDGGREVLAAHEERLAALGVRPHWGQINTLAPEELMGRYPEIERWQEVRRRLDPDGVFASPFSKRVGFTARGVSSREDPAAG